MMKRYAPAPRAKRVFAHEILHDQDDGQRYKQAQRRCDLDEAGVEPTPGIRHVFSHVNSRAAIFAA